MRDFRWRMDLPQTSTNRNLRKKTNRVGNNMTRRSTPGVRFQLLAILTFGMMAWTISGFAQDGILDELTSEQENTSTQADDGNQASEAEVAEQATTVNSEQQTPEDVADDESGQETETAESTTDGNDPQDSGDDQAEVAVSNESSAIQDFLNSGALGLLLKK